MNANSLPRLVRAVACLLIAGAAPVVASTQPASPQPPKPVAPAEPQPLSLPDLIRMTAERHPRLAQVALTVEAARGRAVQAGLYPNPTVRVNGDELGDRTGTGGIWTAPSVSQEIVTAGKLRLSRAVALKEVDQASLTLIQERYRLFTEVRQNYFDLVMLDRRAEILGELVKLGEQSVQTAAKLVEAKEAPRSDLGQLEVDLERYRAELEATQQALPAAFRRLAASVGVNDLPDTPIIGSFEAPLPEYDLEQVRVYVLGIHPEIRSAQIGVERARLALRRAQVEPIPNVTLSAGYTRQNENQSDDWNVGVSVPVPVWNRNQGNVLAAQSEVGQAVQQVGLVQNDIVSRLAAAFGTYAAARKRADRYRTTIVPKARENYQLFQKAFQGGQADYLRVLLAQRSVAEANLEYVKSMGEMWRSASEVAGLMLEDEWPCTPALKGSDPAP